MKTQKEQVSSRFGKSNVRKGAGVFDPHQPEIFMGIDGLMKNIKKIQSKRVQPEDYFLPVYMRS